MSENDNECFFVEDFSSTDSSLIHEIPDLFDVKLSRASILTTRKTKEKKEPSSLLSSLKNALEINTKMRQLLRVEIDKIKIAAKINLEKQDTLKEIITEEKLLKSNARPPSTIRAISVFAAPYFRDVKRMVPPINEDTKIKLKNHDVDAYLKPPRPWSHDENQKLLNGVTAFALMAALKPYKIRRDFLKNKLKNKNVTAEELLNVQDQIDQVEKEITKVSGSPLHELLDKLNGKIDWMIISAVDLEGTRSPEDCESFWKNYLDFSINKEAFTEEEDERLKDLAKEYKEREWDAIAEDLQTNRTAIQCFERYQTKLNQNLTKKYWTPEEDKQLIDLVQEMKVGSIIPWNKIALYMEGRTRSQIINRYERSISQAYNRGPWTSEEDAILLACHSKFGPRWAKMKPFFKRRSTYSIRERYVNALDPSIKMGCWTKGEDKFLISLVRKYGFGKWSKICKHIPGRTDNMCLVRANRLLEHSIKYYSDQGIEYDTEVNDPELFAKILRPIAPTKVCVTRNMKMKGCREAAFDMFFQALEKVDPSFLTENNADSIDFKLINVETMLRVSDELHEMLMKRESKGKAFVPSMRYFQNHSLENKRVCPLLSDEEPETFQEEPDAVSTEEKCWMDAVLTALFHQVSNILPPNNRKTLYGHNTREKVESTLYKAYLYKQFRCKASFDDGDDLEHTIFSGVDYSETLQTVVTYFVQPPVYENQFIIMAPNITTMGGMEVIEATEPRLQSMASFVDHSEMYLQYLCEKTYESPICFLCSKKQKGELTSKGSPKNILSRMKEKLFAIDETLEEAAAVESASMSSPKNCSCEVLRKSIDSVCLLRKRLIGLFLWPALLASTKFTDEQNEALCKRGQTESEKNYFQRMNDRKTHPSSWKKCRTGLREAKEMCVNSTFYEDNYKTNSCHTSGLAEHFVKTDSEVPYTPLLESDEVTEVPKPKRKRQKKVYPATNVRRSKRLCTLNRKFLSDRTSEQLDC